MPLAQELISTLYSLGYNQTPQIGGIFGVYDPQRAGADYVAQVLPKSLALSETYSPQIQTQLSTQGQNLGSSTNVSPAITGSGVSGGEQQGINPRTGAIQYETFSTPTTAAQNMNGTTPQTTALFSINSPWIWAFVAGVILIFVLRQKHK